MVEAKKEEKVEEKPEEKVEEKPTGNPEEKGEDRMTKGQRELTYKMQVVDLDSKKITWDEMGIS